MECKICFESIDQWVYYKMTDDGDWKPFDYCYNCLLDLLKTQWKKYFDLLIHNTCEESTKRLLKNGPPTHFHDTHIEHDQPIYQFKYNNTIVSSSLTRPIDDDAHQHLTRDLQSLIVNDNTRQDILDLLNTYHVDFN